MAAEKPKRTRKKKRKFKAGDLAVYPAGRCGRKTKIIGQPLGSYSHLSHIPGPIFDLVVDGVL